MPRLSPLDYAKQPLYASQSRSVSRSKRRPEALTTWVARPRAAASQAAPAQPPAADLTTLAPKDAADKPVEPRESRDSTNRKGVNCHHYPARCR